jgi:hypothetical protein
MNMVLFIYMYYDVKEHDVQVFSVMLGQGLMEQTEVVEKMFSQHDALQRIMVYRSMSTYAEEKALEEMAGYR